MIRKECGFSANYICEHIHCRFCSTLQKCSFVRYILKLWIKVLFRGNIMLFCTCCGKQITEEAIFCPECGTRIVCSDYDSSEPVKICKKCGEPMPIDMFYCLNCGTLFKNVTQDFDVIQAKVRRQCGVWKDKWVAFLLCLFFGYLGAHKFYEGKVVRGFLYLSTLGIFGVGWIIDIIILLCKPNPYQVKK